MKVNHYIKALLLSGLMLTACQNVKYPEAANSGLHSVDNLQVSLDIRNIVFRWDESSDVEKVYIYRNGKQVEELPHGVKTYSVYRETPNTDVLYTFKVRKGELMSEGVTQTIHIDYDGNAGVAFVLPEGDESKLTAEEKAVADWFQANYVEQGQGCFVTPEMLRGITSDLSSTINPDRYSTLWFHLDRDGGIPVELSDEKVVAGLKTFSRVGGRFYFSYQGVMLLQTIGRLSSRYAVKTFASTVEGAAPWGINANIGGRYDMSESVYYQGLTKTEEGYFPMQSDDAKAGTDYMWGLGGSRSDYRDFQDETYSTVLGTIRSDKSYEYAALVEFSKYTNAYTGLMVANGLNSCRYFQSGANVYQANVEQLTRNILNTIRIVK